LNCRECSLWITESVDQHSEWSKPESS
jgi:hypothetical protein